MDQTSKLLAQLAERCARNLGTDTAAQGYLRANGVTDESVWRRYRLGIGDKSLLSDLDAPDIGRLKSLGLMTWNNRFNLAGTGIAIPTYDPRQPDQPIGFIRARAAQNKHGFATAPAGVACAADVDQHQRVIITDAPLLCLRLAQLGVTGVILAETPEVLPPLTDWLKTKTLILTAYKKEGLSALASAFASLGIEATTTIVNSDMLHTSEESFRLLGIDKASLLAERPETEPVTPQLIASIVEYAQRRIAEGDGLELLRQLDADDPELVNAYGLGYLPADFRSALPRGKSRSLSVEATDRKLRLGNSIIVPAVDRSGTPVDLLAIHYNGKSTRLFDTPAGLLGAKVAAANDEVLVVDSFGLLASHWKDGNRNVLLLRGSEDANLNTERMYESGVRSATVRTHRNGDEIAKALNSAGIEVGRAKVKRTGKPVAEARIEPAGHPAVIQPEMPAARNEMPPEPAPVLPEQDVSDAAPPQFPQRPTFVSFDPKSERATFTAGDATYSLEVTLDDRSKLEIRLERGGNIALDSFDLAVEAQRRRFATSAALRTGVPFEVVMEHVLLLLDDARRIRSEQLNPITTPLAKAEVSKQERDEALAFLRQPHLLEAIGQDMEEMGWVGEEKTKALLFLVGLSRKLERPLSAALRAPSGAGKSTGQETISALTPPEDVLHVSRLTDTSLYYHAQDALRHKLIVIDEADAVTPEVAVSLRVLQSRGSLSQVFTERDQATGKTLTQMADVQGPVAVMTSTTAELEEELLARCYQLTVDDSPDQTRRILEAQRRVSADSAHDERRAGIVRRHHAMQRVLQGRPVVIPFASRIEFPATSIKFRREQQRFLSLISASALLHQYQRKQNGGHVVADEQDFRIALELVGEHVARAADELSDNARDVLSLVIEAKLTDFDINDLKTQRPNWTRHKFRAGLDALLIAELLATAGRTRPRRYSLLPGAAEAIESAPVRLRPLGELATSGERPFANTTQNKATG